MRPAPLAVVSLVSAVLGAAVVLLVASTTGWIGDTRETVVVPPSRSSEASAEPASVATSTKPLPGNSFDAAAIYAQRSPGVVTVFAVFGDHVDTGAGGQGSGFVVSPDGYIMTSSHVVTDAGAGTTGSAVRPATQVFVEFSDGDRVGAKVVGWDVFDDVGVLKVDPKEHPLAPIPLGDSSRVVVGEPVAAIGSPFGQEGSLAVGVVSATQRSVAALTSEYQLVDAIQTDAPINKGNSGGPLLDARGRAIGINAQIRSDTGLAEGVGFAVPINAAKRTLDQLVETGHVSYAYAGISTDDLTPALARDLGLPVERGALVVEVRDGPAGDAGLRGGTRRVVFRGREVTVGGDVVVAIDGEPVTGADDLVRAVTSRLEPGRIAVFSVVRGAKRLEIPVRLGERPADPPAG